MGNDWSNQFNSLLSSPLGKELMRSLKEDLHDGLVQSAQSAKDADVAFGLLKESSGVIKVMNHLRFLSTTLPTDEGSKG